MSINSYRYGYQGEYAEDESDETGIKANSFQLRLYDARLGRWLSPDPYRQFHSPYLAMGNNPTNMVDPDGGWCYDANDNQIPCGDIADVFGNDYMHTTLLQETSLIHYNAPSYDNNIIVINIEQPLNGINPFDLIEGIEDKLMKNGLDKNTEIRPSSSINYGFIHNFNIWNNEINISKLNIRDYNDRIKSDREHKAAAGYAGLNSNLATVYRGLDSSNSEKMRPLKLYIHVAVHELGHALFGFSHERGTGYTDNDCGIMDYRTLDRPGPNINFSDENVQIIKSSKWGSQ